jgi:hypothetical protein
MKTATKVIAVASVLAVGSALAQVAPDGGQVSGVRGKEPMKFYRDGGTVPALQGGGTVPAQPGAAVSGVRGKDNQPHLTPGAVGGVRGIAVPEPGGAVSGVRGKDNQPHLTPGAIGGVRGIAVPEPGGAVSGVRGKEPMKVHRDVGGTVPR